MQVHQRAGNVIPENYNSTNSHSTKEPNELMVKTPHLERMLDKTRHIQFETLSNQTGAFSETKKNI